MVSEAEVAVPTRFDFLEYGVPIILGWRSVGYPSTQGLSEVSLNVYADSVIRTPPLPAAVVRRLLNDASFSARKASLDLVLCCQWVWKPVLHGGLPHCSWWFYPVLSVFPKRRGLRNLELSFENLTVMVERIVRGRNARP